MIRQATIEDSQKMLEIAKLFFAESGYSQEIDFDADSFLASFEGFVNNESSVVFVYVVDGEIVGAVGGVIMPFYCNMNHKTGQELFWFVKQEYRNTLAGKKLFDALENWAKSNGCNSFFMTCIEPLNSERLTRFYRINGYRKAENLFIKKL